MASTRFVVTSTSSAMPPSPSSTPSTWKPAAVRRRDTSAGVTAAGNEESSRSHSSESFIASPSTHLPQQPLVALEEQPDVGDAVTDHRHAIEPHAEREAAVHRGIEPAVAQHARVDHAATEDLHPAGVRAG